LVDQLENKDVSFALYIAGAVGSMAPVSEGKTDLERAKKLGEDLENVIHASKENFEKQSGFIRSITVDLPLRDPTPKLTTKLALRSWVFNWAFGDASCYIKALRVGNVLMVGVPCDFSGELMPELTAYANRRGLQLMVTGFNGGYIGYIVKDNTMKGIYTKHRL
jgi:neutral ceramidase